MLKAVREIKTTTVVNCFGKTEFKHKECPVTNDNNTDLEETTAVWNVVSEQLQNANINIQYRDINSFIAEDDNLERHESASDEVQS